MQILGANDPQSEEETRQLMGGMAHTAEETFMFCFVRQKLTPCLDIFESVKTDIGMLK